MSVCMAKAERKKKITEGNNAIQTFKVFHQTDVGYNLSF
jgi:hypothetical protein